ncbi:MAG: uL15 family ribosomal protein [Candidatus Bathyarchaeia archaeon]
MKGGRGKSGLHKHKWSYTVKYAPDHFGRRGFFPPTGMGALSVINVGELDRCVDRWVAEGKAKLEGDVYHVDLGSLGYAKLLGEGQVTKPIIVKTRLYSEHAASKIEAAGGKLVTIE